MIRAIINPYFIYIFSFGTVGLMYQLGWSNLYPPLSQSLITFFLLTSTVSYFIGRKQSDVKIEHPAKGLNANTAGWLTIGIGLGFAVEFLVAGTIPLIAVLRANPGFDYRIFGIPTLHVVLVTLGSFVAVSLFNTLCYGFQLRALICFLINLSISILIMNRGMFLMILTGCFFVYVQRVRVMEVRNVGLGLVLSLLILYGFGILGNLRQSHRLTSESIVEITEASAPFKESIVPKAFMWSYLYFTSPLANLQQTIDVSKGDKRYWKKFFLYELLPDFISKRLGKYWGIERDPVPGITGWLTASTFYSRSYLFMGWLGMAIMFCYLLLMTRIYLTCLTLIRSAEMRTVGLALLNTVIVFNVFDNMFTFTGLIIQLTYPLLFSLVSVKDNTVTHA